MASTSFEGRDGGHTVDRVRHLTGIARVRAHVLCAPGDVDTLAIYSLRDSNAHSVQRLGQTKDRCPVGDGLEGVSDED